MRTCQRSTLTGFCEILNDSSWHLPRSSPIPQNEQAEFNHARLADPAAAQTEEEQADARDVIAQVHDPVAAAAGTAAAAAGPDQSAAAARK